MEESILERLLKELLGSEATYVLAVEILVILVSYFIYCYRQGRVCFRNTHRGRRRRQQEQIRRDIENDVDIETIKSRYAPDGPDDGRKVSTVDQDASLQTIHIHVGDERQVTLHLGRDGTVVKVIDDNLEMTSTTPCSTRSPTTSTLAQVHQSPVNRKTTAVVHVKETIV